MDQSSDYHPHRKCSFERANAVEEEWNDLSVGSDEARDRDGRNLRSSACSDDVAGISFRAVPPNGFRQRRRRSHLSSSTAPCSTGLVRALTIVSLSVLLSLVRPCRAACNYRYNWSCSSSGGSTTLFHTFTFTVDSGSSYAAAATFSWDEGSGDAGASERRTGTFDSGEEALIEESYTYDQRGSYDTRFTLYFGEGAGDCEGYFYEQTGKFVATSSCSYNGSLTGMEQVEGECECECGQDTLLVAVCYLLSAGCCLLAAFMHFC